MNGDEGGDLWEGHCPGGTGPDFLAQRHGEHTHTHTETETETETDTGAERGKNGLLGSTRHTLVCERACPCVPAA